MQGSCSPPAAAGLRLTTRLVLRRRACTRHGSVCVNASLSRNHQYVTKNIQTKSASSC